MNAVTGGLERLLPQWVRAYRVDDLRGDLAAGVTVAVMLVPQGMAYAMLAGLPPVVGLYASILPLLAYAAIGSSYRLAVGPVAMVSLLVAGAVSAVAEPGTDAYIGGALLLALMVGAMQLGLGILRAGAVVKLLAHPVVVGFTSGAAVIIAASRLSSLTGVDLPRSQHVHAIFGALAGRLSEVDPGTTALGLVAIGLLVAVRRWAKRVPGALAVVILGAVAVGVFGLDVAVVGHVPRGLPTWTVPTLDRAAVLALLPAAAVISAIGFMESIAVARALARRHGRTIDSDRELIGLGAANLAAAFTGGYPVTGGFSRSAVNDEAGARTPLASVVTAALVAATVVLLTPLFRFLPEAVLGAIIVVAVLGLVDVRELRRLWTVDKGEAALLLVTFAATLTVGIELGLLVGIVASALLYGGRRLGLRRVQA